MKNEKNFHLFSYRYILSILLYHCGEAKTQRKCFLDEKRDGLVDENRVNNKEKEKQQSVFYALSFCL